MTKQIELAWHFQSVVLANQKTTDPFMWPPSDIGRADAEKFANDFTSTSSLISSSTVERALQSAIPLWKKIPKAERLQGFESQVRLLANR